MKDLQAGGAESLRAIAAGLEKLGIPRLAGAGGSAVQVARLMEAASCPFDGASASARSTTK